MGDISKKEGALYFDHEYVVNKMREGYPYFRIEDCRTDIIRQGAEYTHPDVAVQASSEQIEMLKPSCDLLSTPEERQQLRDDDHAFFEGFVDKQFRDHPEWKEFCYLEEYDAPGCPEEPDQSVHIVVLRQKAPGPHPTIFYIPVRALVYNTPYIAVCPPMAKFLGVNIVIPVPRTDADGEYPATVNDCHAGYQWMVDHAKEIEVDLDRVAIAGGSSGGQICSAFPFRLKRYHWCRAPMPRGVLVDDGFFDDKEKWASQRMINEQWCGITNRAANMLYFGKNFASGFIGPEGCANHATVEECRGLPPYLIYIGQDNCGSSSALEFTMKLTEAGVYCNLLFLGGATHARPADENGVWNAVFTCLDSCPVYEPRADISASNVNEVFLVGGMRDLLTHDFRRLPLTEYDVKQ